MKWFVGKKNPGTGDSVREELFMKSILAYEPRIPNGHGGTEFMFPGYIMIGCDGSRAAISKINGTRGLRRLLPVHCEEPLSLPDAFVYDLQDYVESLQIMEPLRPEERLFRPNELLKVSCGEHAQVTGIFQRKKKGRIEILTTLLGRQCVVTVPVQNIANIA